MTQGNHRLGGAWIGRTVAALLALAMAAAPAVAERKGDLEIGPRGKVTFDGQEFPSMAAFQTSRTFREAGLYCATREPVELQAFWDSIALEGMQSASQAASTSHCTMSSTTIQSEYDPGTTYTIPVVFHVIRRTDGTGNLSQSFLQSQIDVLNEDFRALDGTPGGPGTDAGIQFALATTDPSGNPTDGINYHTSNDWFQDPGPGVYNNMKDALNWDPTRYLNIYTNDASGALGYATFPQQSAGSYDDGVVLLWSSVGRDNPDGGIYDQGRTGTHEVGHWLGLFHTFQSGCGSSSDPYGTGDLISDTAQQSQPNYNCPTSAASCGSADPIRNYMNYTQDTCMWELTSEQVNRARCGLVNYRAAMLDGGGGDDDVLENGVPISNLSGSSGSQEYWTMDVPSGASDLAIQISGGSGDADLYVKYGSQPTTSSYDCRPYRNGNNETCSFASPAAGTWHVMLRGYTSYSGVTLQGSYSTAPANAAPTASFTFTTSDLTASFTDTSTDSDGTIASRSWSFGDGTSSSAANPSHTYGSEGTYTVTLTVTDDDGATDSASQSVSVTAPPTGGCSGDLYTGSLSGSGDSEYQPNGTYYYSGSGTHSGVLDGPSGTDFDLYLYKWNGSSWSTVRSSTSSTSREEITYSGTSGYYTWRVRSYSGSGSYTLCLDPP